MKVCKNCGQKIKDDAKFCPFCGFLQEEVAPVTEETTPQPTEEVPVVNQVQQPEPTFEKPTPQEMPHQEIPHQGYQQAPYQQQANQQQYQQQENQQQYQQQVPPTGNPQGNFQGNPNQGSMTGGFSKEQFEPYKEKGKMYFSFLMENVKHPGLTDKKNTYHGLANFIVTVVLTALGLSHFAASSVNHAARGISQFFTGSTQNLGQMNNPFPMLLPLLILLLALFGIQALSLYVYQKNVAKENITILGTFNSLFAPISLVVFFAAALFIFSFMGLSGALLIFVMLSLIFFFFSSVFIGQVWLSSDKKLYRVLLTLFINAVVMMIVLNILVSMFASSLDLDSLFQSFSPFNY